MTVQILRGDCATKLRDLPDGSVNCVITSPPYFGLRSYLPKDHPDKALELGLELTPDQYVASMVQVFRECRRVLRDDGTLWLNIGDSYNSIGGGYDSSGSRGETAIISAGTQAAVIKGRNRGGHDGLKPKDLIGVPWRLAFALQADGWWLRDAIIWAKPNGMPGSQEDRCTSSYEFVFLLSKSARYFSDFDAIKTPPREASMIRTAQDVQAQAGSHRANGGAKTNGTMKAVGVRTDKQRGHSRRHAGFNDRWDAMEKAEQQAKPATMRNVWFIPPAQCSESHYAVMPDELVRRCLLAGCPQGGGGSPRSIRGRGNRRAGGRTLRPRQHPDRTQRRIHRHRRAPYSHRRAAVQHRQHRIHTALGSAASCPNSNGRHP